MRGFHSIPDIEHTLKILLRINGVYPQTEAKNSVTSKFLFLKAPLKTNTYSYLLSENSGGESKSKTSASIKEKHSSSSEVRSNGLSSQQCQLQTLIFLIKGGENHHRRWGRILRELINLEKVIHNQTPIFTKTFMNALSESFRLLALVICNENTYLNIKLTRNNSIDSIRVGIHEMMCGVMKTNNDKIIHSQLFPTTAYYYLPFPTNPHPHHPPGSPVCPRSVAAPAAHLAPRGEGRRGDNDLFTLTFIILV